MPAQVETTVMLEVHLKDNNQPLEEQVTQTRTSFGTSSQTAQDQLEETKVQAMVQDKVSDVRAQVPIITTIDDNDK